MKTVGEALVSILEAYDVDVVFGIPGVHTVELYRGLASSKIRHITPRHEQGAGFMADGYARVSGKPGVCLVITGPGLTNTITAMAQAYQDSVPMLVISGVNARPTLGHGRGELHELPDQHAMMSTLAVMSHTLLDPNDLHLVMERAFSILGSARPGPVHIEIPTDVMVEKIAHSATAMRRPSHPRADADTISDIAAKCRAAKHPLLLCGGGAVSAAPHIKALAERLDAPVVTTTNARGIMSGHALSVPASPSLKAVRKLVSKADLVIGLGTQMGPTDYDMNGDGGFPSPANFIRVDIDSDQLSRGPFPALTVHSTVENFIRDLLDLLQDKSAVNGAATRAESARNDARTEVGDKVNREIAVLDTIREAIPGVIIVGDSTQAVYAGNLYYEADRPNGWFNAATGYGALGYGPPAAIGAAIAEQDTPVVCLVGDGGFQFSLAEIGAAKDEGANVTFLVWNNDGYDEIKNYMVNRGIEPEGVSPSAPDFVMVARAYDIPASRLEKISDLTAALHDAQKQPGPFLIEMHERIVHPPQG